MQQVPAATARWVFRTVAGDAPGPSRRILGGFAVALLVVLLSIAVPVSVLASLSTIATLLQRIAVPEATPDRPTIAWGLVAVTSVGFVGAAAAVSWTAGRRTVLRRGPKSPILPGDNEPEDRVDGEAGRAPGPQAP